MPNSVTISLVKEDGKEDIILSICHVTNVSSFEFKVSISHEKSLPEECHRFACEDSIANPNFSSRNTHFSFFNKNRDF